MPIIRLIHKKMLDIIKRKGYTVNMKTDAHIYTHLGKAPYTLIGYEFDPRVETANGWQGGNHACDHCGRGIAHVFIVKSSDGKVFTLGSEHAKYLGDDGLVENIKARMAQARREAREEANRAQRMAWAQERAEREANLVAKVKAEYQRLLPQLQSTPHPNAYFASQGKTLVDYIDYFRPDRFQPVDAQHDQWYISGAIRSELRKLGADL